MASNLEVDSISKGVTTVNTDEIVDTSSNQICKAWVNFNGTGTVAIRDSFNVSSITDNGTGNYTVNLSNALANSNAVSVAGGARYSGGGDPQVSQGNYVSGTSTVLVTTSTTTGSASDHVYIGIAVFGD